jgi:hypothetical protein
MNDQWPTQRALKPCTSRRSSNKKGLADKLTLF